jgi:hypothetical protein
VSPNIMGGLGGDNRELGILVDSRSHGEEGGRGALELRRGDGEVALREQSLISVTKTM